ncbi:FMN-dependent NADH-azoreductase [Clostridium pascui]|uniref:FMN-dependent NADH-azoreductase n=1 Tax=Clostridium pascui TaxID=46609 RepID=UPI00195E927F|nr:FMN-dependent NADH-azoreductase [Clostridium pascui]MBM7868583.1 FMN-dependent NADH-azoreductase [Clostridium pascui]
MNKVLYIKANAKSEELSRTFKISESFIEAYREAHPEDEITTLDLYNEGIDFLTKGNLDTVNKREEGEDKNHPILKYAYQFLEADKYVIAEPLWNLGVPAILKAYIDYISANGITFKYTESGPVGLCTGKKAINITSRGGNYDTEPSASFEMGDRYLKAIFAFLGITDFATISADGLDVIENNTDKIVEEAIMVAKTTARNF